jgi:chitinase
VTATVSDGALSTSRSFDWTVVAAARNTPPVLNAITNQTTEAGKFASIQLSGSDADGDQLTYGANGLPPGLALTVAPV